MRKLQIVNSRVNQVDTLFLNLSVPRDRGAGTPGRTLPEANSSGVPLLRLLFIDNAQTDCALLARFIELGGYTIQSARVETAAQMREALFSGHWDAVISELDLPAFPLADVLTTLRESGIDTPVLVATHTDAEDAPAEALAAGATDFVSKSRLKRLMPALKRSIAQAAARRAERVEHARLLQSHGDHVSEANAVVRDLHDTVGELITDLSPDLTWFADNAAGDAAGARVQNMRCALDRACARAARSLHALRSPLSE